MRKELFQYLVGEAMAVGGPRQKETSLRVSFKLSLPYLPLSKHLRDLSTTNDTVIDHPLFMGTPFFPVDFLIFGQ